MNVNDLAEMMRQRSDDDPVPILAESRIAGVRRKVEATRRRRITTSLAVVAVIAAVLPFTRQILGTDKTGIPVAAPSAVKTINGFPEYANGGHLVATRTAALDRQISITLTPTGLGLEFSNRCPVVDPHVELEVTMTLRDGTQLLVGCTPNGGAYASEDSLVADHIRLGEPTVLTFSAKAYRVTAGSNGEDNRSTPIPVPAGSYSVAVFQKVPFDQYPLPPRPAKLLPLNVMKYGLSTGGGTVDVVDSDPTDPLAPRTITFTMPDCGTDTLNCNPAIAVSQTPGYLQITVNGVVVGTAEFWDYSGGGWSFNLVPNVNDKLRLHAGELVTITITPRYVTGAWKFAVAPGTRD